MSKKCYRFFGGLLNTQEKWLNKMSEKGYRLVRTGKLLYEFEKCKPDEVTYCVEFIGEKSKESSIDYAKSTHNRRERPVYGHRGGSRGRFYYRITTFEERPWDARDPHKTTFMALKHAIRLSI